jgi:hypothetical protein
LGVEAQLALARDELVGQRNDDFFGYLGRLVALRDT